MSDNYLLRSLKTLFLFTFIPSLRPKSLKCSIDLSSLLLYKTYGAFLSRLLTRISLVLELLILNLPHAKQLIERVFWASSEAHMCLKCHIIGLQQKVMVSFAMLKSSMTSCCTNSWSICSNNQCMRERVHAHMDVAQLVRLPNGDQVVSWVQPLDSTVASSQKRERESTMASNEIREIHGVIERWLNWVSNPRCSTRVS